MCSLALKLWKVCLEYNVDISVSHIPARENCKADWLSGTSLEPHDYSLPQQVFERIVHRFERPLEINLFAFKQSHKLLKFCSLHCEPEPSYGNGFSHLWSDSVHVFPPIHLIFKVITKFLSDQVFFGTLITPYWPGIPNLPIIFPFLTSNPLFLSANPLQGPSPDTPPIPFVALTISCATAMTQEFLKTLHLCRKDNDASPILSKE